jgi:hypothetical protein
LHRHIDDVISLSVYVCFIVFRHDMAEITVESGVKHHNLNPLEHDVITLSVYVCFIVFRHDMAEITVKSGVKHHNLNPLVLSPLSLLPNPSPVIYEFRFFFYIVNIK